MIHFDGGHVRGVLVFALSGCSTASTADNTGAVTDASAETPTQISTPCGAQPSSYPSDPAGATSTLPLCVPVCSSPRVDGFVTTDALPAGSCTGPLTCYMAARKKCSCDARGPVDSYRCTCVAGAWQCAVVMAGGAVCVCVDGGPEAG